MTQFVRNKKCMAFCLLLLMFGVATAFGGTKAEDSTSVPSPVGPAAGKALRLQRRIIAATEDQMAEEAYKERNARITRFTEDSTPQRPVNAALLYYQAFLLRPEPNEAVKRKMYPSIGPDRQIRTYLGHCLPTIEIVEIASRMPGCIWGMWSEGPLSLSAFGEKVGSIVDILLVDAKTLAVDKHYGAALERCLTVRRFARHLSEDTVLYLGSMGCDQKALNMIRQVLGEMRPDTDILTWLRGQLAVVQGSQISYTDKLQREVKAELNNIRVDPNFYRKPIINMLKDEQEKENARNLTDEQILLLSRRGFQYVIDPIFRVLDSEMTYEQKRIEMRRLINELKNVDSTGSIEKAIINLSAIEIEGIIDYDYSTHIGHEAQINGTKAAVEVYLVLAKTGKLPDKLPDYVPKDPFTGQDFLYVKTNEGFAFRSQSGDFPKLINKWLEFKVRK